MSTSQNGWPAPPVISIHRWQISKPPTPVILPLLDNAVGFTLAHLAVWFHENIEPLTKVRDDWGYAFRPIRGETTTLSNHASGTAMDLNATQHPRGGAGLDGFDFAQISAIHRRLARMHRLATNEQAPGSDSNSGDWVIRWGFDYHTAPVDGMHFEYNRVAASFAGRFCASVADRDITKRLTAMNPDAFHPHSLPHKA